MLGTPLLLKKPGGAAAAARPARSHPAAAAAVLDERGRPLRLHGAFTGGFSAGYHNTVGSAEGWQPASFHSSRSARAAPRPAQSMADYLDEEDDQLLGATLAPTLAYDAQGGRGLKRGREVAEQEARGGGSGSAAIPGPVPEEMVVPVAVPVGQRILAAMAARGGRGAGGGAGASGWARRLQGLPSSSDQGVAALFREGTARAPGLHLGLGYDPGALRMREDALAALARGARGVGAGSSSSSSSSSSSAAAASAGLGTRRLHMAHALSAGAYGEEEEGAGGPRPGVGGGRGAPLPLLLRSGAAMAGGGEEGDEDDAAAYRQPSMRDYDIPLNAREAAAAQRAAQRAPPRASTSASASASSSVRQGLVKDGAPEAVGWNGLPALAGFDFAVHVERTFSQWARAYAPPTPPAAWVPAVIVAPPPPPPPPPLPALLPAAPAAPPAPVPHHQPSAARLALDALLSKQRFVSEGAAGAPAASPATAAALAPIAVGTACRRVVDVWLPAALLLRRFDLPDPFSRAERQRLEALEASGAASSTTTSSSSSSSSSSSMAMPLVPLAAASAAAAAHAVPLPPPPPPAALLATLAPLLQPAPPPSVFNSLFGAGWSFM